MNNIEEFYPLSPIQQGILFHTLYAPESGVYVEQLSFDIQGNLNISLFQQAWQQLIERHSILRTSFISERVKEPVQVVHKKVELPWQQQDLSGLELVEQQESIKTYLRRERKDFEISQAPLMRLMLLNLAEKHYKFVWTHHHLLVDGWSSSLLLQELFTSYKLLTKGKEVQLPKSRPYRDYVAWIQKQKLLKAESFWRQYLKDFTTATLLGKDQNLSNQIVEKKHYNTQVLRLSNTATVGLNSLARQQQLTLNTIVQGVWAILLSRYSGENDIVFGGVVSGRPATFTGVESMVGVFINTLPIRVEFNPQQLLIPWLKQLQIRQNELQKYEYTPLIEIQKWSEISAGQPLFETIFNFQNYSINSSLQEPTDNLKIFNINGFIHPHYPLNISVQVDSELLLEIFYDFHRFEDDKITCMLGHFQTLLEAIVADPQQKLSDLPLLTEPERQQLLVEWNDSKVDYPQGKCIHQLFEEQVEKTPEALAVVFEEEALTYAQLNIKANQLAHYLQTLGVQAEVKVGICVERSLEMVIGLLAILKAGGAYIPLDPNYPTERTAFILEQTQAPVLLTQASLREEIPANQAQVVYLDTDWHLIATRNQNNLSSLVTCDNLAYIIYTSGSTGKPKGVQIPHLALSNFLSSMRETPGLSNDDTLLAVTTYSFDIAALELFLPIIVGARLVVASQEIISDGIQLSAKLIDSKATVMQATPATWQLILATGWNGNPQLKVLCGGEALPAPLATQLIEKCDSLWNMYGPTETTIWSAANRVKTVNNTVPISRPIANTQLYILNKYNQLVPVGVAGELCIGGEGLARGYFHRPDLTAEKFIPNPFSKEATRLYKTGDLARYLPNGEIEYIGRIDHQVKVRGFRIELGEIEAVISQHPAVRETVVVVREDVANFQQIVAYVVAQKEQTLTISKLRSFLELKLPNYMVPSTFVILEALPLTPNGKVDRKALPMPNQVRPELEKIYVAPQTKIEQQLADIWSEVLGLEKIGMNDNFFESGGHSLLATQVISRINKTFDINLPLRRLFEFPTLAKLTRSIEIEKVGSEPEQAIQRVSRNIQLPLSFNQRRLWFLDQLEPNSLAYNFTNALFMKGMLKVRALENSINEIVRRHEVLRTYFKSIDGQPIQKIVGDLKIFLPIIDLQNLPETERQAEVQRLGQADAQQPFNLKQTPLLLLTLVRLKTTEHILLVTMHHIISDAWSAGIFIQELSSLYKAFSTGQPSPLPELPIQYVDYAIWQQKSLNQEKIHTQLAYWKQQLEGAKTLLELPTDRLRSQFQTSVGTKHYFTLSKELSHSLKTFSQQQKVTLFMTLLAAYNTLLYFYTKQEDILVGSPIANRNRSEIEGLIGFFANTIVLRTDLSKNPSFKELLQQVKEVALAAYTHQDLPFEKLVTELQVEHDSNRSPLFQVWFVLQNAPTSDLKLEGLDLNIIDVESGMVRHDLNLNLSETLEDITGFFEYKTELFNANTIIQMATLFKTLLPIVVTQPDIRLQQLISILNEFQKEQQIIENQRFKQARRQKLGKISRKKATGIK